LERAKTISELLDDSDSLEAAVRRGVREALLRHKALGNPVVFFENGETVVVAPEDLEVPEEP